MSQVELFAVKGVISELPEEDQQAIRLRADEIKKVVQAGSDKRNGICAFSLAALELEDWLD